ncbi:MAG: hypothetical protein IJN96_02140 [Clostridia bacterium]|nr:hypothetical protein [Clostridia bacterium]
MKQISEIDKNLKVETQIAKDDIRFRDVTKAPFGVYGVFVEDGKFRRMPGNIAKRLNPRIEELHTNTAGGRVRFRTDSPYVAIKAKMNGVQKFPHCALTGLCGFDMYVNESGEEIYTGTFMPPFDLADGYESVLDFERRSMREITINFPTYSGVTELYVGLAEDAEVLEPTPYKSKKPVVYYGSSITQGGCASRPGNIYQNIITRRFDIDYINLGFSGNAKGEPVIAEYIAGLDMSAFIYDYDYNAPDVKHLRETHRAMFEVVRRAHPEIPIVLMSRPKFRLTDGEKERLEVIRDTYESAKASGDANVYLITGPELMALAGNEGTVDNCHPNDLGFFRMANTIRPVLEEMLDSTI